MLPRIWLFFSILSLFFESAQAFNSFDASLCEKRLRAARSSSFSTLTSQQEAFLREILLPVVGTRVLVDGKAQTRNCQGNSECFTVSGFSEEDNIRFEWGAPGTEPWIEIDRGQRVLKIPAGFDFQALPDHGASILKRFLMGHSLHPYIASPEARAERKALGEPGLILKAAQQEAIAAATETLEAFEQGQRGRNKFLFVAPTGVGKSEVLVSVLLSQLRAQLKTPAPGLHLVIADQNFLVGQLSDDVKRLKEEGIDFEMRQWGGKHGSAEISELVDHVKKTGKPVVLLTTIQSLKARILGADRETRIALIREVLKTLAYDEAHHSGADQAVAIIKDLIDHPDSHAFLYGTTATPIHYWADIQGIFGNSAFWAYLDSRENYRERGGEANRDLSQIVEQLARAIEAGELSPFDKVYFLDPHNMTPNGDLLMKEGEGNGRYIIKPEHYPAVARRLSPLFMKHKKGFITANSIDEARDITAVLNKLIPKRKFAFLHSDMTTSEQEETRKAFREEDGINFLVTVRQLDEGINYPEMTLYVDLNRSIGARQFLQRTGRVLRIFPHKLGVDVVTLVEMDEARIGELLLVLKNLDRMRVPPHVGRRAVEEAEAKDASDVGLPVSEVDYQKELAKLNEQVRSFWQVRQSQAVLVARELNLFVQNAAKYGVELSLFDTDKKIYQDTKSRIRSDARDRVITKAQERAALDWASEKLQGVQSLYDRCRKHIRDPEFLAEISNAVRAYIAATEPAKVAIRANQYVQDLRSSGQPLVMPPMGDPLRKDLITNAQRIALQFTASSDLMELLDAEGFLEFSILDLNRYASGEEFDATLRNPEQQARLVKFVESADSEVEVWRELQSYENYFRSPEDFPAFWSAIGVEQRELAKAVAAAFSEEFRIRSGLRKLKKLFEQGSNSPRVGNIQPWTQIENRVDFVQPWWKVEKKAGDIAAALNEYFAVARDYNIPEERLFPTFRILSGGYSSVLEAAVLEPFLKIASPDLLAFVHYLKVHKNQVKEDEKNERRLREEENLKEEAAQKTAADLAKATALTRLLEFLVEKSDWIEKLSPELALEQGFFEYIESNFMSVMNLYQGQNLPGANTQTQQAFEKLFARMIRETEVRAAVFALDRRVSAARFHDAPYVAGWAKQLFELLKAREYSIDSLKNLPNYSVIKAFMGLREDADFRAAVHPEFLEFLDSRAAEIAAVPNDAAPADTLEATSEMLQELVSEGQSPLALSTQLGVAQASIETLIAGRDHQDRTKTFEKNLEALYDKIVLGR
jgi:superfamily II DNA or RNA helicase